MDEVKDMDINQTPEDVSDKSSALKNDSRRRFMQMSATASIVTATSATGLLATSAASADDFSVGDSDRSLDGENRAKKAAWIKRELADEQKRFTLRYIGDQLDNNDERRYRNDNFYASFYKCLPQNNFGEVDPQAFRKFRRAMRNGKQSAFNAIPLDGEADRKLANPQGAFRFEMTGLDSHATRMPPAPTFRSAKTAAEMGEVYWQALTRDVPFIEYDTDSTINKAVSDLNSFSETVGPTVGGNVTPATLFRGETDGDVNGPFVSQFLLKDIPYGPSTIEQKYFAGLADLDYMVDKDNWLNIQRGGAPLESFVKETQAKYINNNRNLGEYVHSDVVFQAYFNAALILLSLGPDAQDTNNPYLGNANQGAFTSFGGPWVLQLLTYAGNLSLSGAWFHKWRVHRRLRPEAYGGRVNFNMTGQRSYEIHDDILNSYALTETHSRYGSYFLPMAYTEGSPTHPAYPAGHATIAGACCTILKAFFNEDYVMQDTVQSDASGYNLIPYSASSLTLGGEVNKLANNISIGRDAAGVHYRTDGVDGLNVGEDQAIRLLKDHLKTVNEDFDGFTLTKFDGTKVLIK